MVRKILKRGDHGPLGGVQVTPPLPKLLLGKVDQPSTYTSLLVVTTPIINKKINK